MAQSYNLEQLAREYIRNFTSAHAATHKGHELVTSGNSGGTFHGVNMTEIVVTALAELSSGNSHRASEMSYPSNLAPALFPADSAAASADPSSAVFLPSAAEIPAQDCLNATLFEAYIRGLVRNVTTLSRAQRREIEGDPLLYIVVVLIIYSCGIAVLMINYMKKVWDVVFLMHSFFERVSHLRYDLSNERNRSGFLSV